MGGSGSSQAPTPGERVDDNIGDSVGNMEDGADFLGLVEDGKLNSGTDIE